MSALRFQIAIVLLAGALAGGLLHVLAPAAPAGPPAVASISLSPARLYLGNDPACDTGTLALSAFDSDGNPLDASGLSPDFNVSKPDLLSVDPDGTVHALRAMFPGYDASEYAASVTASSGGRAATAFVTVFPWCPVFLRGDHFLGVVPPVLAGQDIPALLEQHHFADAMSAVFLTMRGLTGDYLCQLMATYANRYGGPADTGCLTPPPGEVQEHIIIPSNDPHCGGAGNPTVLCEGHYEYGDQVNWFTPIHEMGHNFSSGVNYARFVDGSTYIAFPRTPRATSIDEGFANLVTLYAMSHMGSQSGLPGDVLAELSGPQPYLAGSSLKQTCADQLAAYEASGETIDNVSGFYQYYFLCGVLAQLGDEYGWDIFMPFFRIFHAGDGQDQLWAASASAAQRNATFVAALSAATGADLRDRFEQQWRFELDRDYYDSIYETVRGLVTTPVTPTPSPTPVPSPTATPSPTPAAGQRLWGDIDCSGRIDSVDALKLLRYVASLPLSQQQPCPPPDELLEVLEATPQRWADMDCDGVVEASDALRIQRYIAALDVTVGPDCPRLGEAVTVNPV